MSAAAIVPACSAGHQPHWIPGWDNRGGRFRRSVGGPKQWFIASHTFFRTVAIERVTDPRARETEIGRTAGIARPWDANIMGLRLVSRIWVERLAKGVGKVRWVVVLAAVFPNRNGPRVEPAHTHARDAGPPTASGPRRRGHGSWVAHEVVIVCIDEILPPEPMCGQGGRNRCIMVEPTRLSPSAEPKQDKEHDRRRGESHDHKDTGHRAFVGKEALAQP